MNKVTISIPEPCHEDYSAFDTVSSNSAHCQKCQKVVTDFSRLSDEEIIEHFNHNTNVCGRFLPHQLDKTLSIKTKEAKWKKWLLLGLFVGTSEVALAQGEAHIHSKDTVTRHCETTTYQWYSIPNHINSDSTKTSVYNPTIYDTPLDSLTSMSITTGKCVTHVEEIAIKKRPWWKFWARKPKEAKLEGE